MAARRSAVRLRAATVSSSSGSTSSLERTGERRRRYIPSASQQLVKAIDCRAQASCTSSTPFLSNHCLAWTNLIASRSARSALLREPLRRSVSSVISCACRTGACQPGCNGPCSEDTPHHAPTDEVVTRADEGHRGYHILQSNPPRCWSRRPPIWARRAAHCACGPSGPAPAAPLGIAGSPPALQQGRSSAPPGHRVPAPSHAAHLHPAHRPAPAIRLEFTDENAP